MDIVKFNSYPAFCEKNECSKLVLQHCNISVLNSTLPMLNVIFANLCQLLNECVCVCVRACAILLLQCQYILTTFQLGDS